MGNDAYTVLKYVISSNNETIMSCHAKESEWIGFGSPNQIGTPYLLGNLFSLKFFFKTMTVVTNG